MKTRLLIIFAIVGVIILGSGTYVYSQMYDCLNPPLWMKVPHFGFENCFELFLSGNLPDWTQAKEDYEKKQALRIKLIEQFKDKPEVVSFYSKYEDANVSVRDDHVSYFAGSEDGFFVRMNFYFDQNYELDYIDFHCYYQNETQFEFPQEDIATKIAIYDCKEHGDALKLEPGFAIDSDKPVYPKFDGVTEIINPEHESLEYRATSPVIDYTYLSKNVQQWKDVWEHELQAEYEKYGDEFYIELGKLLMKTEPQTD